MIAEICLKTGWTYEQFNNQPDWLIELIIRKHSMDAEKGKV